MALQKQIGSPLIETAGMEMSKALEPSSYLVTGSL